MAPKKSLKKLVTQLPGRGSFASKHLQLFCFLIMKKFCPNPKNFRAKRAQPTPTLSLG
jgi:hypothetical protein